MPAYAVLGAQWGDEGKGKIVDFLSQKADVVARFAGGNNAGHTVLNDRGKFTLHIIPSGIFWPQAVGVIGNGTVVDPDALFEEIDGLRQRGVELTDRLMVSERCHLVMPYHILLDDLSEVARGSHALGTTGKGIGPTYSDKAARSGVRASDLADLESLRPRLEKILQYTNGLITKVYGGTSLSVESVFEKCRVWAERLMPYIGSVEQFAHEALEADKIVLLEGAQGAMLDIDHGTYPFVTSSNPTIGGACVGMGIHPRHIAGIIGVFKAYSTRVGLGPLPTELMDETGDNIRELAQEFGATTGRPRRVGWFDAVAARYSGRVNGYTTAVLTRLDVLDGFHPVKICTAYELDGKVVDELPGSVALLDRCKPIFEEHPGWDNPTAGATSLDQLPKQAISYVERLQELIGCPVDIISTGPRRNETITVRQVI